MKKLVILRSVTGRAREYAEREFAYSTFFDSVTRAVAELKDADADKRPWLAVVDASGDTDLGLGAQAAGWGYMVENRSVP